MLSTQKHSRVFSNDSMKTILTVVHKEDVAAGVDHGVVLVVGLQHPVLAVDITEP